MVEKFIMKFIRLLILFFTLTLYSVCLASSYQDMAQNAFQKGHFELAVQYWAEALSNLSPEQTPENYIDTSIRLATAYHSLGRLQDAFNILEPTRLLVDKIDDPIRHANVLIHFSDLYFAMRVFTKSDVDGVKCISREIIPPFTPEKAIEKAMNYLKMAEYISRQNDNPLFLASLLNKKGNMLLAQVNLLNKQGDVPEAQIKYFDEVLPAYEESIQLAQKVGDKLLSVKVEINLIQGVVQFGDYEKIETELKNKTIFQQVQNLSNSHDKAFAFIRLAHLVQKLQEMPKHDVRLYASDALKRALKIAGKLKDNHAIAYAKSDLAKLYADEKRYNEAIQLTRNAIFHTQNAPFWGSPDLLFRWEWQLGKFLKADNQYQEVIHAYEQAARNLKRVRATYGSVPNAFYELEEKFYFDFADILLKRATETTAYQRQQLLKKAIDSIESFKRVELRNYLTNDCLKRRFPEKIDISENLPNNTAILYPLLFEDRIELLLISPDNQIQHITSYPVESEQVINEVRALRYSLSYNRYNYIKKYIRVAQQLYRWFILPINHALLEWKIDTLIIVPHGILSTISFAALHDGKQYLIEKYAIAIIPGLKLIELKPLNHDNIQILLGGVSKSVQGFSPLPYVSDELLNIHNIWGGELLLNEDFTFSNLETKLKNNSYSILHFATTGNLSSNLTENFLLTYDDKLTKERLETLIGISKFRNTQPLELITLSSCETARGNRHTLFGLIGIMIKAGARSALGNLWPTTDKANAYLMTEFYRQLKINPYLSKAKALQKAQLRLLKDKEYNDPYFWAPFILIGNWL
jgi:CHAT domain-containing protein